MAKIKLNEGNSPRSPSVHHVPILLLMKTPPPPHTPPKHTQRPQEPSGGQTMNNSRSPEPEGRHLSTSQGDSPGTPALILPPAYRIRNRPATMRDSCKNPPVCTGSTSRIYECRVFLGECEKRGGSRFFRVRAKESREMGYRCDLGFGLMFAVSIRREANKIIFK